MRGCWGSRSSREEEEEHEEEEGVKTKRNNKKKREKGNTRCYHFISMSNYGQKYQHSWCEFFLIPWLS